MDSDLRVFSGSAHPVLAREICEHLKVPLGQAETIRFSNENMMIRIKENVREKDVFVIQTSCSPVSEGIVELLIMIDTLKHASAARITAVTPYFPYVRSDKKDQPRISIAARLMADLLETAGANRVLAMDLHSPQVQGFFRIPTDQLIAAPIICDYLSHRDLSNYVLIAADAGEAKDIGRYANRLNLPIAIIDKRRDGNDERPKAANIIGEVKDKHALIMDDEIASAGTIMEASRFLLEKGVLDVRVGAVHPVLSGQAVTRIAQAPIEEVVVTNTIPVSPDKHHPKIKILSVAPLFARAIKCIHNGDSISSIFG